MSDFLIYRTQTEALIRAKIVTRHRNGDITVEPFFYVDAEGRDTGCFQGGHKVRLGPVNIVKFEASTMPAKRAPVAKRVYLTGDKRAGYTVLIKDHVAATTIWQMEAPTMKAGHAVVRALRELDGKEGIF